MKISLIIPAYNEEGNVNEIYNEVTKVLKDINYDYEILFVNDGSTDKTEKNVSEINIDQKVKLISFTRNFGHMVKRDYSV